MSDAVLAARPEMRPGAGRRPQGLHGSRLRRRQRRRDRPRRRHLQGDALQLFPRQAAALRGGDADRLRPHRRGDGRRRAAASRSRWRCAGWRRASRPSCSRPPPRRCSGSASPRPAASPQLGAAFHASGLARARSQLIAFFEAAAARGELAIDDPETAADQFVGALQGRPLPDRAPRRAAPERRGDRPARRRGGADLPGPLRRGGGRLRFHTSFGCSLRVTRTPPRQAASRASPAGRPDYSLRASAHPAASRHLVRSRNRRPARARGRRRRIASHQLAHVGQPAGDRRRRRHRRATAGGCGRRGPGGPRSCGSRSRRSARRARACRGSSPGTSSSRPSASRSRPRSASAAIPSASAWARTRPEPGHDHRAEARP